jgi:hypothetical protein
MFGSMQAQFTHTHIVWLKGCNTLHRYCLEEQAISTLEESNQIGSHLISSLEDVRKVKLVASWSINPNMLKLFGRSKDFNPRV